MTVIGDKVLVEILDNKKASSIIQFEKKPDNYIGLVKQVGTGKATRERIDEGDKIVFCISIEIPTIGNIVNLHDIIAIYE